MSCEESYSKTFPFDKMVRGMQGPEMITDTAKIVNEALNDRYRYQQPRRRKRSPDRTIDPFVKSWVCRGVNSPRLSSCFWFSHIIPSMGD